MAGELVYKGGLPNPRNVPPRFRVVCCPKSQSDGGVSSRLARHGARLIVSSVLGRSVKRCETNGSRSPEAHGDEEASHVRRTWRDAGTVVV